MSSSSDHRKFTRIDTECDMGFNHPSTGAKDTASCLNLSAAGILFATKKKLTLGSSLEISVKPINPLTPSLNAIIEINRVIPTEGGSYKVAATIEGIKGL